MRHVPRRATRCVLPFPSHHLSLCILHSHRHIGLHHTATGNHVNHPHIALPRRHHFCLLPVFLFFVGQILLVVRVADKYYHVFELAVVGKLFWSSQPARPVIETRCRASPSVHSIVLHPVIATRDWRDCFCPQFRVVRHKVPA